MYALLFHTVVCIGKLIINAIGKCCNIFIWLSAVLLLLSISSRLHIFALYWWWWWKAILHNSYVGTFERVGRSSRQDKSANKCFDVFLILSLLLGSCQAAYLQYFLSLLCLQSGPEIKSTRINLWPLRWWREWGFGPSWGCWLSALDNGCHRLTSCHNLPTQSHNRFWPFFFLGGQKWINLTKRSKQIEWNCSCFNCWSSRCAGCSPRRT